MKATFVEMPSFAKSRERHLDDDAYGRLQDVLATNPECGDVVPGGGGLRKMRFGDVNRGKGKRGGLRVLYYVWIGASEFWLFDVYGKGEKIDLTPDEKRIFREALKAELAIRRST